MPIKKILTSNGWVVLVTQVRKTALLITDVGEENKNAIK